MPRVHLRRGKWRQDGLSSSFVCCIHPLYFYHVGPCCVQASLFSGSLVFLWGMACDEIHPSLIDG